MRVTELGHVSLFVRDLESSVGFYRDILGLRETGTGKNGRIVFLSAGAHHHDLSLELARADAPSLPAGAPGLYHVAFCVGGTRDALEAARRDVERLGLVPFGEVQGATPCFCVKDPDGHTVELYAALPA
jgi:catechol 2,3-dioxygenase